MTFGDEFSLQFDKYPQLINVRSGIRAVRVGKYAKIDKRTAYVYFGL